MASCGNPSAETDALMQSEIIRHSARRPLLIFISGRKKYDKSKTCVKCKAARGSIVIRHAVYCR